MTGELRRLAGVAGPTPLADARDRALLLLGFAAALRRSELAALNAGDAPETEDGLVVHVRRGQTDQEGTGDLRGVPYGVHPETCPVRALHAWLTISGITEGPLFRPITRHGQLLPDRLVGRAVARIIQRACARAGLDAARYGGHSLRVGLATAAAAGDAPEWSIMRQGGWRSSEVTYTELERLVLEYAEAMTTTPPTVTDELVARLREQLGDARLVELTELVAVENLRSRFNSGLGLESQGFKADCALPQRAMGAVS